MRSRLMRRRPGAALGVRRFIAPCVQGGRVRARLSGLLLTWSPTPRRFEGWGLFEALDLRQAVVVQRAETSAVLGWQARCRPVRLLLVRALASRSWLAVPACREAFTGALGEPRAMPVHLVEEGRAFDAVLAVYDGAACWYAGPDSGADPVVASALRAAASAGVDVGDLSGQELRDEHRVAYAAAARGCQAVEGSRGARWGVRARDLSVISAGICMAGAQDDVDLCSLVGVH